MKRTYTEFFSWGSDEWGQLGHGSDKNTTVNVPKSLSFDVLIKQMACGANHTLFLTVQKQVFAFGDNQQGQLGIDDKVLKYSNAPLLIPTISSLEVSFIAAGSLHTGAVTGDRRVYMWGSNVEGQCGQKSEITKFFKPQLLDSITNIEQIDFGSLHSCFLTHDGQVYTCGDNRAGQCGLGNNSDTFITTPQLVQLTTKIVQVAAGFKHTLLLNSFGHLIGFGSNERQEFGLGEQREADQSLFKSPFEMCHLKMHHVVKVRAGSFSACLNDKAELIIWGTGQFGCFKFPQKVCIEGVEFKDMQISKTVDQQCAFVAALDNKGLVYSWGNNDKGQLGHNNYLSQELPLQVMQLRKKKVEQIQLGQGHFVALGQDIVDGSKKQQKFGCRNIHRASSHDLSQRKQEHNHLLSPPDIQAPVHLHHHGALPPLPKHAALQTCPDYTDSHTIFAQTQKFQKANNCLMHSESPKVPQTVHNNNDYQRSPMGKHLFNNTPVQFQHKSEFEKVLFNQLEEKEQMIVSMKNHQAEQHRQEHQLQLQVSSLKETIKQQEELLVSQKQNLERKCQVIEEDYTRQNQRMMKDLDTQLQNEVCANQQKLNNIVQSMEQKHKIQTERLQHDCQQLEQMTNNQKQTIQTVVMEREHFVEENKQLKNDLSHLEKKYNEVKNVLKSVEEKNANLFRQCKQQSDQLIVNKKQQDEINQKLNTELGRMENQLTELETRVKHGLLIEQQLNTKLNESEELIKKQSAQIHVLSHQNDGLQAKLQQLHVDWRAMDRQHNEMHHQLENKNFDCQQLQDSLTNKDQMHFEISRVNQDLKQELDLANKKLHSQCHALDQAHQEISRLQQHAVKDSKRIKERDQDIEELESALVELKRDMQDEFRQRDNEAQQLQDKISEAEQCLKNALEGLREKDNQLARLNEQLSQKEQNAYQDSQRIASLEKTIVDIEENNKRLQELLNEQICSAAQRYSQDCQERLSQPRVRLEGQENRRPQFLDLGVMQKGSSSLPPTCKSANQGFSFQSRTLQPEQAYQRDERSDQDNQTDTLIEDQHPRVPDFLSVSAMPSSTKSGNHRKQQTISKHQISPSSHSQQTLPRIKPIFTSPSLQHIKTLVTPAGQHSSREKMDRFLTPTPVKMPHVCYRRHRSVTLVSADLENLPKSKNLNRNESLDQITRSTSQLKTIKESVKDNKKYALSSIQQSQTICLPSHSSRKLPTIRKEKKKSQKPIQKKPMLLKNTVKLKSFKTPRKGSASRSNSLKRESSLKKSPSTHIQKPSDQAPLQANLQTQPLLTQRVLKSSLSTMTIQRNTRDRYFYNDYEKLMNQEEEDLKNECYQGFDIRQSGTLLRNAETQISQLTALVKRLIPEDDKHTIIDSKQRIEVIPDSQLTYKIPCEGQESPLKIYFKTINLQGPLPDLQVYISQEDHVPTKMKCEQCAILPSVVTVHAYNKKEYFTGFNIYLTLYSESGMSILINPVFSTVIADRQARFRKRQKQGNFSPKKEFSPPLVESLSNTEALPQLNIVQKPENNICKQNIQKAKSPHNRTGNQYVWMIRNLEANENRQRIEEERRQHLLEMSRKWQLEKDRKKMRKQIAIRRLWELSVQKQFIRNVSLYSLMKQTKFVFDMYAKERLDYHKQRVQFTLFKMRVASKLRQKASTPEERLRLWIRNTLIPAANGAHQHQRKKAFALVHLTLNRALMKNYFNKTIHIFITSLKHLQRQYRSHSRFMVCRKYIWKEEFLKIALGHLQTYFAGVAKKTGKKSKVEKRIIDRIFDEKIIFREKITEAIIHMFFRRQQVYCSLQNLVSKIVFKSYESTRDELAQMQEAVDHRLQLIYEYDVRLFMQIEMPKFQRYNLSKIQQQILKHERLSLKLSQWNAFDRVTKMLVPRVTNSEVYTKGQEIDYQKKRYLTLNLKVEGTSHSYDVEFHSHKCSRFNAIPTSVEIFQRLVLRGILADDESEFAL